MTIGRQLLSAAMEFRLQVTVKEKIKVGRRVWRSQVDHGVLLLLPTLGCRQVACLWGSDGCLELLEYFLVLGSLVLCSFLFSL